LWESIPLRRQRVSPLVSLSFNFFLCFSLESDGEGEDVHDA
jgi:hypothetical protein